MEEVIEENLIENYDSEKWNNEEVITEALEESKEEEILEDGSKLISLYYDENYNLCSKDDAIYVRKDLFDQSGELIDSRVIEQ